MPPASTITHRRGLLITALGVIALSPDGLLNRLITAEAWTILFWRGLWVGLGMTLLLAVWHRCRLLSAFLAIGRSGLLIALLYFGSNACFVYAFANTNIANTLFFLSTTPLWAALIAWLIFRDPVAPRTWFAILATTIGVIVICLGKKIQPDAYLGNVAGLLAAVFLASIFSVIARHRDRDLLPAFALGGFLIALVLAPVVTLAVTRTDMGYLFLMGFVMLPIAGNMLFIGPRYISAAEVSLLMLLETILGPLWVWWALQEHPGHLALIGGTLVLTTLAIHSGLGLRARR